MHRVYLKFIISVLTLAYSLSYADYHYASHSGSNIYPYASWETATDSVNAAVDAADPGDTIYIAAGDYEGLVIMFPADSLISLIGAGADSTHLFTNDAHRLIYAGPKTYFKGLKMSPLPRSPWECIWAAAAGRDVVAEDCIFDGGQGIITAASNLSVHNCIFENMGMGIFDNYTLNLSLEVTNCLFRNNEGNCIDVQSQHAIVKRNIAANLQSGYDSFALYYADGAIQDITNNLAYNTWAGGIQVGIADTSSKVNNNTIDHVHWPGIGFNFALSISSPMRTKAENNSIAYSDRGVLLNSDSLCSIYYTDLFHNAGDFEFWHSGHGSFDTTNGLLHVNPMYNDPDSGDFRLQMYSPLIDAGDPDILDVDGTRSDIGAYGGPGGCSYVYLDLAPQIPDSIFGRVDSSIIVLSWKMNSEADFNHYQVYRDTFPGFSPSVFNMVSESDTCLYRDSLVNPGTSYFYRLTSVDNQNNISGYSDEVAVRPVGIWGNPWGEILPKYSVITSAYPNPFNSDITIVYSASNLGPQPPEIKLYIYDIGGRVVRTLVNERKACGTYRVTWDGKDDMGNRAASGSYIAKLSQWGMSAGDCPVKITLVK